MEPSTSAHTELQPPKTRRRRSLHDFVNAAASRFCLLKGMLYYRRIFASFGQGSILHKPALLVHPQYISIGARVHIYHGVRLEAIAIDDSYTPVLRIGNNVNIEHFVQISTVGKLIIGDNVGIGSRTMINCSSHPFMDAKSEVKVSRRIAGKNAVIEIGEGVYIGSGVTIFQNVRIGRRAVIGANAVVKSSVPAFCVVEGNPAVVVLHYSAELDRWLPGPP